MICCVPSGQVGQRIGIDPRRAQAAELDPHVAQDRLRDLAQQFHGHGGRAVRPLTCRNDPPPIAAMAFNTPGSKLLLTATEWNVPWTPHAPRDPVPDYSRGASMSTSLDIRRSRLAKATGSASPVVTMPSPI